MRLRTVLVGLFSALLFLTAGCEREDSRQRPSGTAVVVLFDLSGSTESTDVRKAYCENFRKLLSGVSHGDALAAGWIVESSVDQPALPVDTVLESFSPESTNPLVRKGMKAEQDSVLDVALDSIHARICRHLRGTDQQVTQTDITTSLDLASDILEARPSEENVLVIMSDMIEESERYQFDEMALTERRRKKILRRASREGRIPNLSHVRVCVVGASASNSDRYYRVEEFWTAYFDSAGAELARYGGPYIGC